MAPSSMKKRVICQLCNFSPETPGTFVDSITFLAAYCRDRMDLETFCVFPAVARNKRWLRTFDEMGIRYGFVPRKRNVAAAVGRLLLDWQPVIFHSHFSLYDFSPVLLKIMGCRKSKILWHYHNPTPPTFLQRTKDVFKLQLVARTVGAACIAVGDGVYRSLLDAGFCAEKVFLVHNGVDTTRFSPDQRARTRMRELLGIGECQKKTLFLLLGGEPSRKGVDVFVKAAAEVVRAGFQSCGFLIVGDNKTKDFVMDLSEYPVLREYLKVLDPVDDFPSLVNAVDVFVSASRSEGLSYAVAEALSAGKLALCSDIPGVREVYGNVDGVRLFPTQDSTQLAELMRDVGALPAAERERLGKENRKYVAEQCSLAGWAAKVGDVYSRILQA